MTNPGQIFAPCKICTAAILGGRILSAALSAMDGANADQAGALIGPADEGHCNELQIHVFRVRGTAMKLNMKLCRI